MRLLFADIRNSHLHINNCVFEMQAATLCNKRLVGKQGEINGVGIAVVPSSANATESLHLAVVDNLETTPHILLALPQIRNGVFSKEMRHINIKAAFCRIVEPIESTTLSCGDFRADAILVGSGIVAKSDLFADAALGNGWPAKTRVESRG